MRSKFLKVIFTLALIFGSSAFTNATIASVSVTAACGGPQLNDTAFFNLRPWYSGLMQADGKTLCRPVAVATYANGNLVGDFDADEEMQMSTFVWRIVFNVADILLTLIGYAAVLFVVVGGFHLLFSNGDPAKVTRGKVTIGNSLIGVVAATLAGGLVRFINDTLIAGAQTTLKVDSSGVTVINPPDTTNIWVNAASNFLFMVGIAALAMVVWGGVRLSSSAGNPQLQAKAKNTIIFALLGTIIMVLAGAIVRIVFDAVDDGKI
ncbi:MAG: hypothetical protein LBC86_06105 [Oscillospiraceae bacterium]|jgi:hypothetical protein|nr:hypothetical protein [Oscillospiraceae bacterium]